MATKQSILLTPKKDAVNPWVDFNPRITYVGKRFDFVLPNEPERMPLTVVKESIQKLIDHENQLYSAWEVIEGYPLDAAVAFAKALDRKFHGLATGQTRKHWWGDVPPQLTPVRIGKAVDAVVQVPMGDFKLPGMDHVITARIDHDDNKFVIMGDIPKKHQTLVTELATLAREILKEESIYKGKPIRLPFDRDGDIDWKVPPEYLDVSDVTEESLIFNSEVMDSIKANVIALIRQTVRCYTENIPLNRKILFEGIYGTGKSLAARWIANEGEMAGWTYILVDKASALKEALRFAVQYQPAIVFAEDIDRAMDNRDLINEVDSVVSKGNQVMVVLTTNYIDKIPPVMLRPGRLDAIIPLDPPNEDTRKRLIRLYAGRLMAANEDLTNAAAKTAQMTPSAIRECVERAKLGMIVRGDHGLIGNDICTAAASMAYHMSLLNPKLPVETVAERLHSSLRETTNGHDKDFEVIHHKIGRLGEHIALVARAVGARLS